MNRRMFLGAAALLPCLIRLAFADASVGEGDTALERARTQAFKAGRALLVIGVPSSEVAKVALGTVFGLYLNEGSDVQLAPLAHVDVVCAALPGDALLALMLPGETVTVSSPPRVSAVDGWYRRLLEVRRRADDWRDRVAATAAWMAEVVADLTRRAPGANRLPAAIAAEEVRTRLVRRAPPGAHWAIEGRETDYIEGMFDEEAERQFHRDFHRDYGRPSIGLPPPKRRERILYFHAKTPQRRYLEGTLKL